MALNFLKLNFKLPFFATSKKRKMKMIRVPKFMLCCPDFQLQNNRSFWRRYQQRPARNIVHNFTVLQKQLHLTWILGLEINELRKIRIIRTVYICKKLLQWDPRQGKLRKWGTLCILVYNFEYLFSSSVKICSVFFGRYG